MVRVRHSNKNVAQIPRFPQTKTEGQLDKGQREGQTTLGNRSVFSRLNFILKNSFGLPKRYF